MNLKKKVGSAWAVELKKMQPQQLFTTTKKAINDTLFEGQMGTVPMDSTQMNNLSRSSSPYGNVQPSPISYHYDLHFTTRTISTHCTNTAV
jgi:hypothetical protein